jgi:hypothetical protein
MEGRSSADPCEESGARSNAKNPTAPLGRMSELQNLATSPMAPEQCDWLPGQGVMMDGGNAATVELGLLRSGLHWSRRNDRSHCSSAKFEAALLRTCSRVAAPQNPAGQCGPPARQPLLGCDKHLKGAALFRIQQAEFRPMRQPCVYDGSPSRHDSKRGR